MVTTLFDQWTEQYDSWFETPVGRFVRRYETRLLLEMLAPLSGDRVLDVGCGTGIFTQDVLSCGAEVIGIDLSCPMLKKAIGRTADLGFTGLCGDMYSLPFPDNCFDKVYSMTAIEFVPDVRRAVAELNRVVRRGGRVVVTTLNSLSPWAVQRKRKGKEGHPLFGKIFFRSPDEMRLVVPANSVIQTAIHFQKNTPVADVEAIEAWGDGANRDTGAFLAVQWEKE